MKDAFALVRRDGLNADELSTLDDFNKFAGNVAYVNNQRDLFMISGRNFKDQRAVIARIIESESLCSAFADALDELSESDLAASAWLIREIGRSIGERFVGQQLEGVSAVPRGA